MSAQQFVKTKSKPREVVPPDPPHPHVERIRNLTINYVANLNDSVQIQFPGEDAIEVNYDSFSSQEMIGSGAFGEVYSAAINANSKQVALKVMTVDKVSRELLWVEKCNHENITHIYGAFSIMGPTDKLSIIYLITELATCSLDEVIKNIVRRNGPSPPVEERIGLKAISHIAYQIIQALDFLSIPSPEKPFRILHKDLKPKNVLVFKGSGGPDSHPDVIKLCDFGISNYMQTSSFVYSEPKFRRNLAPETALGHYQPEADVWSLGYTLLELYLLKDPFGTNEDLAEFKVRALVDNKFPVEDIPDYSPGDPMVDQFREFIINDTMNPEYYDRRKEVYRPDGGRRKRYPDLLKTPFILSGQMNQTGLNGFLNQFYIN